MYTRPAGSMSPASLHSQVIPLRSAISSLLVRILCTPLSLCSTLLNYNAHVIAVDLVLQLYSIISQSLLMPSSALVRGRDTDCLQCHISLRDATIRVLWISLDTIFQHMLTVLVLSLCFRSCTAQELPVTSSLVRRVRSQGCSISLFKDLLRPQTNNCKLIKLTT